MIFRHGNFHADPHPANVFVLDDGRLGLVDFGITGALSPQDMRHLTRLLIDAVNENVDQLPRRLHDLGVRFNREQEDEFRLELREIYYRYHGAALGEIDPLEVIREAFGLIARMHLRLPTRFALLTRPSPHWARSGRSCTRLQCLRGGRAIRRRVDGAAALTGGAARPGQARRSSTTAAC